MNRRALLTGFSRNLIVIVLPKFIETFQFWLKSGKNSGNVAVSASQIFI
jgi:hypothetical protein